MKKIKAILLSPPWAEYRSPCLAIGSLSAYLGKQGYDVEARHIHLDAAIMFGLEEYDSLAWHRTQMPSVAEALAAAILFPKKRQRIIEYVGKSQPNSRKYYNRLRKMLVGIYSSVDWRRYDLVGFSANFDQLFASLVLAHWIKRDYPGKRVVIGGRLVAGELGESIVRHFSQIDWCVDGEGEQVLKGLLDGIASGDEGFEKRIPGLIYRDGDLVITNGRPAPLSLKGYPDPDFDDFFRSLEAKGELRENLLPYLPLEIIRGCNYRCAFCCDWRYWGNARERPAKESADSIRRMSSRYGISKLLLVAPMVSRKYAGQLFPLLEAHGRDYAICTNVRATIDRDSLLKMKRAGVIVLGIGMEALDTKLLRKMNKGIRLIDNLKAMKYCEEIGIKTSANMILGFPTETQADIDRSTRVVRHAVQYRPPINEGDFTIYQGSTVYLSPGDYGIRSIDHAAEFGAFLRSETSKDINLWYKRFKGGNRKNDYSVLHSAMDEWRRIYGKAKTHGYTLLYYQDCGDFVQIVDYRRGTRSRCLRGVQREIYLFCNEIRTIDDIKETFSSYSSKEIDKVIRYFVREEIVFKEGDSYLSLAVRSENVYRSDMAFL